jgi:hypothetical protein
MPPGPLFLFWVRKVTPGLRSARLAARGARDRRAARRAPLGVRGTHDNPGGAPLPPKSPPAGRLRARQGVSGVLSWTPMKPRSTKSAASMATSSSRLARYSARLANDAASMATCSSRLARYSARLANGAASMATSSSRLARYSARLANGAASMATSSSRLARYSARLTNGAASMATSSSR